MCIAAGSHSENSCSFVERLLKIIEDRPQANPTLILQNAKPKNKKNSLDLGTAGVPKVSLLVTVDKNLSIDEQARLK